MADVKPYVLKVYSMPRQMLLPYIVVDVIAIFGLVDGITIEANGITSS